MNLTQLSIKYNTKEKCIAHLEKVRWGDTPACLLCGSIKVSRRTKGIRIAKLKGVYEGRAVGSKEDVLSFLSKPKNKEALTFLKKAQVYK